MLKGFFSENPNLKLLALLLAIALWAIARYSVLK